MAASKTDQKILLIDLDRFSKVLAVCNEFERKVLAGALAASAVAPQINAGRIIGSRFKMDYRTIERGQRIFEKIPEKQNLHPTTEEINQLIAYLTSREVKPGIAYQRGKGAGCKRSEVKYPEIMRHIEELIKDSVDGQSGLCLCKTSLRKIRQSVQDNFGVSLSCPTISRILKEQGYNLIGDGRCMVNGVKSEGAIEAMGDTITPDQTPEATAAAIHAAAHADHADTDDAASDSATNVDTDSNAGATDTNTDAGADSNNSAPSH